MLLGLDLSSPRLASFFRLTAHRSLKVVPLCLSRCSCFFFRRASTRAMCTAPLSVSVKEHIDISAKEKQIFEFLIEVIRHCGLQTQLRVAGGWVRDKLLGLECHDIDVALDDMLGSEFCENVNKYLLDKGEESRKVGVVQRNPDQSKHLETANMRIFGVQIDFVNLRAEDYGNDSRIPTMRFGTPEEDAFRRDLTINSLFYNIHTNSVEDFTGRGISDLKSGKIVTPLPPKQTFLDDPLRVFRAIRFGSRFNFELDEELKVAVMDDDVKAAINDKVSRERVGKEVDLMISGKQPVKAIAYILQLQLFWAVFRLPPEMKPPAPERCEENCVAYMDSAWTLLQLLGSSFSTNDQQRLCLYAALLLPFRSSSYIVKKGKLNPAVSYIICTSLKLKNDDADNVIALDIAAEKFLSLIPAIISDGDLHVPEVDWKHELIDVPAASKLKILCGLIIQEVKKSWRTALMLSMLLYPVDIGLSKSTSSKSKELNERKELINRLQKKILGMGLDRIWEATPLLNGNDIMEILELKTGGPLVKEWQQKMFEWQLSYPSGSKQDCRDWIIETRSKRARID